MPEITTTNIIEKDLESSYPAEAMSEFLNNEKAFQFAEDRGLEIYVPNNYTLTLDLDGGSQYEEYKRRIATFRRFFDVCAIEETVSKSGNTHVIISLMDAMTTPERIAAQAILASDWKREMFSLVRRTNAIGPDPILLFEKPDSGAEFVPGLEKKVVKKETTFVEEQAA